MQVARVAAMLLVARVAAADVVDVPTTATQAVPVPLDALGWAVEVRIAFDEVDRHAVLDITDDRRKLRVDIAHDLVGLEGDPYLVELRGTHAIRVEASGARRLLLLDGQVVLDHDYSLPDMVVDAPRGVALSATSKAPVRWVSATADTAPRGLAHSASPYGPATHFTGPFATWLVAWAQRERTRRAELAAVVLPEAARMCVAFAIVAAVAHAPRPAHFRLAELKHVAPGSQRPELSEPFDFESPRMHAVPMRRVRSDYAVLAQEELRKALAEKSPGGRLQRAVDAAITASLPEDATDVLLAQLKVLAKRPDACR